ncbi:hypothetical protein OG206_30595 [Streptomyces sp. NBC_01341]|uniref:hypothetical protein n=1 Tax=Streptomyces sp. NBC_01341 TaxID=2903831 RepID=UPI002E10E177|nr:hypothetical protein OG206_30595 [Streptomyces sp. NBC_01341]
MQLHGVLRQLSGLAAHARPANGQDGPVFVDESGRRGKTLRKVGWLIAAVCAAFAASIVLSLFGGDSTAPSLPLTTQEGRVAPGVTDGEPAAAEPKQGTSASPGSGSSVAGQNGVEAGVSGNDEG